MSFVLKINSIVEFAVDSFRECLERDVADNSSFIYLEIKINQEKKDVLSKLAPFIQDGTITSLKLYAEDGQTEVYDFSEGYGHIKRAQTMLDEELNKVVTQLYFEPDTK